MRPTAEYWLCGMDIWAFSDQIDVVLCHTMEGRTNIYPPSDIARDARKKQVMELGWPIGWLILPYTVMVNTRNPKEITTMIGQFKDACIMVPRREDDLLTLPVMVDVVQFTDKTRKLLQPYLDGNSLNFTEEVYTNLKMAL